MVLQHEVEKVDSLIIMLGKFSREMIARSVFLARQEEKEKAYTCSTQNIVAGSEWQKCALKHAIHGTGDEPGLQIITPKFTLGSFKYV
jgi:hypothetical protein